jgi:cathepsin A (carboxypeptidase C)
MSTNKKILAVVALAALLATVHAETPEEIFLGEKYFAGFINITNTSDIFYWYFPSLSKPATDPLIFWLTGGPGCSSEVALFAENGPFTINDDLTLKKNPYSWSNNSNLVFIDQPVGTGFSSAKLRDYVLNETEVAADFTIFLRGFLAKFTEFKDREIFITGESYAGHYIPAIGAELVRQGFPLVGVAIGNGWTNPYQQYPQYAVFSYENKLIGKLQYNLLTVAYKVCQLMISTYKVFLYPLEVCQLSTQTVIGINPFKPRFNVYDIRLPCEQPPLCYNFDNVGKFLERPDVVAALGVQGRHWKDCNMKVHTAMLGDWLNNLSEEVSYLLHEKLKVLVYSGDQDFICNWRGGEAWTNAVDWEHKKDFNAAEYDQWYADNQLHGEYKSAKNFVFLRIYKAGHMVPMDQPAASLAMLNELIAPWMAEARDARLAKESSINE